MESKSQTISADQAIFTSVRTPTGEGYRIIAASPGLSVDEKAEITRRSPSHGGLCKSEPDAQGLSAYPLTSGRYCVACSRYAGKEHTARGGQRVYTHLVVLNQEDYAGFGCHPLRVREAMITAADAEPMLKPPPSLAQLPLTVKSVHKAQQPFTDQTIDHTLQLSVAVLQDEQLLVVGVELDLELFDKTILTLPLARRRGLAASVGLTYSPSRKTQLNFIARDQGETQRATRGQKIRWFDADKPSALPATPFDEWLGFLKLRLSEGSTTEIEQLTSAMTDAPSPESLTRIASICTDTELAEAADQSRLALLSEKYESFVAGNRLETDLLKRFKAEVERRSAYFEELAKKEAELAASKCSDS